MGRAAVIVVLTATACFSTQEDRGQSTDPTASREPAEVASPGAPEPEPLEQRIPAPDGYTRVAVAPGSFGAWLRQLPVRPGRPDVYLYDGRRKGNQSAHHAVLDIDVGSRDLQQCADAVMRLRAEYLLAGACADEIAFNFTSGDTASWSEWRQGVRPQVSGNSVTWNRTAATDDSYESFRRYLDVVFTYAGSASLERELVPVRPLTDLRIGDVFIEGGFPGHAVLVIDVAANDAGQRVFLLAQSYMPAQDIHVLTSFDDLAPWYRARADGVLETPEWDFWYSSIRRFRPTSCETAQSDGGTAGQTVQDRIDADIAGQQPIVVHVVVALCDNQNQGIVPVSKTLGNGQDPKTNLYWGALYGVRTHLPHAAGWARIETGRPDDPRILDRVAFFANVTRGDAAAPVYVVADAWDGAHIRASLERYLEMTAGRTVEPVEVVHGSEKLTLGAGGSSHLVAFVGHNGLMDFSLEAPRPPAEDTPARSAVVLACASKPYFLDRLEAAGAHPLLLTTGLMAPEAYTLDAAIRSWVGEGTTEAVRGKAAKAYDQYQKCGLAAARPLFWGAP